MFELISSHDEYRFLLALNRQRILFLYRMNLSENGVCSIYIVQRLFHVSNEHIETITTLATCKPAST